MKNIVRCGGLFPILMAVFLGGCDTTTDTGDTGMVAQQSIEATTEAPVEAGSANASGSPTEKQTPSSQGNVLDKTASTKSEVPSEKLISDRKNARYSSDIMQLDIESSLMVEDSKRMKEKNLNDNGKPSGLMMEKPNGMKNSSRKAGSNGKEFTKTLRKGHQKLFRRALDISEKKVSLNADGEFPQRSTVEGVQLATIYFPIGVIRLSAHDESVLDQVAQIFNNRNAKQLYIVGHASKAPRTKTLINDKIALDRASAVAGYLVKKGIEARNLIVHALGDRDPKFAETALPGRDGNQRTEIYIIF